MKSSSSRPIGNLLSTALLCAAGVLAGCASTSIVGDEDSAADTAATAQPLSALPAELLRDRSLGVRTGSTPSFYADTPGRRNFGILGVIAMMHEGNRLVDTYGLEDPAAQLSEDLVATLAIQNRMQTSTREAADLLLDIKTINWDFRPYRNDPDNLFVVYSARISLIDLSNGAVLAEGKCRSRRDREGDSATLDQLLADGAKRLQTELREAAQECAQRVKSETLSAFLPNAAPVARGYDAPEPALRR
jgi:hypothetical protein